MRKSSFNGLLCAVALAAGLTACAPELAAPPVPHGLPATYSSSNATTNSTAPDAGQLGWQAFFRDPNLVALIDTALHRNQELRIAQQEIELARQEVRARRGEYLPTVGLGAQAAADHVGRYTLQGATEETIRIRPTRATPDPLTNFQGGAFASWEVDIWHRLRTARQAASLRLLASEEGRRFAQTNLVAEIATSYYELLALDNQLVLLKQNLAIQDSALRVVRMQKEAARATELAVQRFEAQVQNTRSRQYLIEQRITETENQLNFLAGRYPQHIARGTQPLAEVLPPDVPAGVPAHLLENRPDIRQAEQQLAAAHLDVQVARAAFYPRLSLDAAVGLQAFRPGLLLTAPESLLLGLAGSVAAPLVNRNGLRAQLGSADARRQQAVLTYERTLLDGYREAGNQLANIHNLQLSYDAKAREVASLRRSVDIAGRLFASARADYAEVLFTQRDALEAQVDVVETRLQQLTASVQLYRALGGGWR